jgi:DNA-binding response OmpR family regulator
MEKNILLIEDDMLIQEMYVSELSRVGYNVFAYSTGEEGIKALLTKYFDLVILDVMLPGINGLEILKQIKQNPKTKDIKVLMLTNLGQEEFKEKGIKLGAEGYLIKSDLTPDQFVREIDSYINGINKSAIQP